MVILWQLNLKKLNSNYFYSKKLFILFIYLYIRNSFKLKLNIKLSIQMGKGNAVKSKQAREENMGKQESAK